MKLIGAGFGRTGTASLQVALDTLGFGPCYHMLEVFKNPEHVAFWDRASRGEKVDFASFFAGWTSTVDWPGCTFYQELMKIYPDARVLLSVRDPERWYESCRKTIYPASTGKLSFSPPIPPPAERAGAEFNMPNFIERLIWTNTFHDRFEDHDYAIKVFNQHTADVERHVPPQQLLVFDVKDGWEPLCKFLDVPIPADQSFPHLNDTASFLSRTRPD